ncbi:ABC transporter substrate-binding protein [Streptomyces sp. NBC_01408]|uniref:ABC transporter substrate-binding protein n=1 Tax=Streptomyces sp. NBC_01408 TaxID=2903855 RepID=UPI00224E5C15|nr:sugar ABC transporter substrate-binding protein [Streptomyces sp. NBC_01408]MCX4695338.1 sugar ABC transporter substrate-binding protein [Streptomyces sp. NBC_01408]
MKAQSLRAYGAVAAAVSLALLTSACAGSDSPASAAAGDEGKPVTLTYWTWTSGAEAAAAAFNASHKDIQVKFSQIPSGADGYSKISNAIKAGDAPDVTTVEYSMVPEFASQGYLEDLTATSGDLVKKSFPAGVQNLVTFGGKTWSVPFDATPQVYFYRKDLFEKHGVSVPTTWDEYRAAAEKIKAAEPGARIGNFPTDTPLQATLSWQAGAKWFQIEGGAWKPEIDDAPSQKVAAFWQGMLKDDLVFNYGAGTPEENKSKADGTTASVVGASWSAGSMIAAMPDLKGKWGVAPVPHWGTPASGMFGGTSFAVTKGSKHTKAAAEFIKWVTTDPAAMEARIGALKSPSSALPANPQMAAVAAKAFDTSYFGGQDLYKLTGDQVATIVPGWTWGPVWGKVNADFKDEAARNGLPSGLTKAQESARTAIESRGLKLAGQ